MVGPALGTTIASSHDNAAPISDVAGQHRTATVCHLGTISLRLGRKLKWDPVKEECVGDDEANEASGENKASGANDVSESAPGDDPGSESAPKNEAAAVKEESR